VKQARNPSSVHAPLAGYSHQIELSGPARLLTLSGQVGMTPAGEVPGDPAEQFAVALENVVRNLDAANMAVTDLVKLTIYLTEPIAADQRAAILDRSLGGHAPCMTLLYAAALAAPTLKVEIDAWASAEPAD
jgi:2-iminobutanoate/2-iminopropanoate deaminase